MAKNVQNYYKKAGAGKRSAMSGTEAARVIKGSPKGAQTNTLRPMSGYRSASPARGTQTGFGQGGMRKGGQNS